MPHATHEVLLVTPVADEKVPARGALYYLLIYAQKLAIKYGKLNEPACGNGRSTTFTSYSDGNY